MQVMPGTASDMGVTDASDPVQNVYASAKYLSSLLDKYKDPNLAAAAYNAGPGRVDDYLAGKATLPAETQAYVPKVAAAYGALTANASPPDPFAGSGAGTQCAEASTGTMTDASSSPAPSSGSDPFSAFVQATNAPGSASTAPAASSQGQGASPPSDPFSALVAATAKPAAPDATSPSTPSPTPSATTPEGSWHQGTILGSLVAGTSAGFQRAVGGIANLASDADKAVPALQAIDNTTGLDPAHAAAVLRGNAAANDAAHPNSIPYDIGNFAGETAATLPVVETGGGALGLAGGALADALPVGGTLAKAGSNLLTGGGGNAFMRGLTASTSGAAKAVAAGTMANGSTQGAVGNALVGGALGPASLVAAPVLQAVAGGGKRFVNALAADSSLASPAVRPINALGVSSGIDPIAAAPSPASAADPVPQGSPPTNYTPGPQAAPGGPASVPPATPQPNVEPPRVSLGAIPSVKNADQLAQQALGHYQAGGPVEFTPSQIPGVQLTNAQGTGNANVAALERTMRDQNPNFFAAIDQKNAAARTSFLQNIIGTPDTIDAAETARDTVTSQARDAAFANTQPVDASPVVAQLQDLIAKNAGRPTVQAPLTNVLNQLAPVDADTGVRTPLSDPEQLYNVRKYLGDMVAPRAAGTANDGQAAAAQLLSLKPNLDATIEQGAPGFQNYISQYDQLSQPINAMQSLQGKKLLNADGVVQRGPLDSLLHSVQVQQSLPGARAADSITPDQLQNLTALRDDLNMANRSNLGKSLGSNTGQNLFTASKVSSLMSGASGGAADYIAGGIGSGIGAMTAGMEGTPLGFVAGGISHAARGAYMNRLAAAHGAATNALLNKLAGPAP